MSEFEKNEEISLLYPNGYDDRIGEMEKSADAADALELTKLIELKSARLQDFFSSDPEVILYRQETFRDLAEYPQTVDLLRKCVPILDDISSLRRLGAASEGMGDLYLYSITEVELYMSLLDILSEKLLPLKDKFRGRAMKAFCEKVYLLAESDEYKEINERLAALRDRVGEIKSVTVGVNLDGALRPESAGLLAVNSEKFKFGQVLERILRLDIKPSEYTCIAPLIPFNKSMNENEQTAMSLAMNSALSAVFRSSIKAWKKILKSYVLEKSDFLLKILPEIEFVTKAVSFLEELKQAEVPLSYPDIVKSEKPVFEAYSIVNPAVALKIKAKMVPNDIVFDDKAGIYIITGPNRGGKSVVTCAVGQAVLMVSLGLPVCADRLKLSPADNVFCHFPQNADDTVNMGRLGEECARLSEIFSYVTRDSFVLLDESLSSTGSFEASYIASEVLEGFSIVGCRALFSTHLHDLSSNLSKLNETCKLHGGVPIDSLVADITNKERSFKVLRAKPDGRSYAADIAEKYGLSLENILKKVQIK